MAESESELVYLANVQKHLCQIQIYVNKKQRTVETIPIQGTLLFIYISSGLYIYFFTDVRISDFALSLSGV